MTTLAEIEFKYELAKQGLAFSIQTRDDLQERADNISDQIMKDMIIVAILEINTEIEAHAKALVEIEQNIAEYKARLYLLNNS